jgi:hypothetical protein
MTNEELSAAAANALATIDRRRLFWVDIGVMTRDGGSLADVAEGEIEWAAIRAEVDRWLDVLEPDAAPAQTTWPLTDRVGLFFRARPRSPLARGAPTPSFTHAKTQIPKFYLDSGEERSLANLTLDEVRQLARGERRLMLELPSHRAAFESLADMMEHFGRSSTAEIHPTELEVFAGILGLIEVPPGLGDFDEGWRAIHNLPDPPIIDDPRSK